ncbi:MAG: hypothetical protein MJE12_09075 [Alphaproteobacteria bacterium]|nr:hypothetical protein [Alphaproteobacteria bacterium]
MTGKGTKSKPTGRQRRPAKEKLAAEDVESHFVDALSKDFLEHGAAAIATMREQDPAYYIKLCAATLPKGSVGALDPVEAMTDEELFARARQLAAQLGIGLGTDASGTANKRRSKQT